MKNLPVIGPSHAKNGYPGRFMRPFLSKKLVKVPLDTTDGHYTAKFLYKGDSYDLEMTTQSNHIGLFDESCKKCDSTGKRVHDAIFNMADNMIDHSYDDEMFILENRIDGGYFNIVSNKLEGEIREIDEFGFTNDNIIYTFYVFKVLKARDAIRVPYSGFLGMAPVDEFGNDQRFWNIAQQLEVDNEIEHLLAAFYSCESTLKTVGDKKYAELHFGQWARQDSGIG